MVKTDVLSYTKVQGRLVHLSNIDAKIVGQRIHDIRLSLSTSKKMSLEAFGKLLSPPSDKGLVRKWEKGVNIPQGDRLNQIAELGGVTVHYLLFGKELSGYGSKIKNIRENILEVDFDAFGKFFDPIVNKETIEGWENENILPTWDQIKRISSLGDISFMNLLFGIERSEYSMIDPILLLEKNENRLSEAQLSSEDYAHSELFFSNTELLRLSQITNPNIFPILETIIDNLTWLSGNHPKNLYLDKKLETHEEQVSKLNAEIEQSIEILNTQVKKLGDTLKNDYS